MADDDKWGEQADAVFSEEEEQEFELDTSGVDGNELGSSMLNKEGTYHMEVTDVTTDYDLTNKSGDPKSPAVVFQMTVLESVENQSPAGTKFYHRVYVANKEGGPPKEGAIKAAMRFGIGLGVIEVQEDATCVDSKTKARKINTDTWKRAKLRQCIAPIEFEEGTGDYKGKYVIPFGRVYNPFDESYNHVPKSKDSLKTIPREQLPKGAAKPKEQTESKLKTKSETENEVTDDASIDDDDLDSL